MKVVVIGCGAMGSIYAALLADAGNEVHAVDASTAHVAAINEAHAAASVVGVEMCHWVIPFVPVHVDHDPEKALTRGMDRQ